ncbi:MAG TPA: hypothetical protein VNA14_10945 [Mycobacteriales bacterium]|nr:hypothetical protein [Mycobacteriales bacterium]
MTEDTDVELCHGAQRRIVAVRAAGGLCHAEDFLNGLRERQKRAYVQFTVRLSKLAEVGWLRNPEDVRPVEDGESPTVWEIKAHDGPGWRLYGIQDGDTWYLTHGRKKPGDRRVASEAAKARQIYGDRSS